MYIKPEPDPDVEDQLRVTAQIFSQLNEGRSAISCVTALGTFEVPADFLPALTHQSVDPLITGMIVHSEEGASYELLLKRRDPE
jgi:hypothetical protein